MVVRQRIDEESVELDDPPHMTNASGSESGSSDEGDDSDSDSESESKGDDSGSDDGVEKKIVKQKAKSHKKKYQDEHDSAEESVDDENDDDDESIEAYESVVPNSSIGQDAGAMKSLFSKISELDAADAKGVTNSSGADFGSRQTQYRKALALKSQVALHHKLIETRIHLQHIIQCASNADQYPSSSKQKQVLLKKCESLFETLFNTRQAMTSEEYQSLNSKIASPISLKRATVLQETFDSLKNEMWKPVLNKRHAEVQLRSGKKLLHSSNSNKRFKSVVDQTLYDQVESTVTHERLLHNPRAHKVHTLLQGRTNKTEKSRDNSELVDENAKADDDSNEENPIKNDEATQLLYNDTKLYSNMLKDYLKSNANQTTLSGGSKAAAERQRLQKQLAKQKNKLVDRRASKGRKIRYNVNEKLVNFTFPIPRPQPTIEDDVWFQTLFRGGR